MLASLVLLLLSLREPITFEETDKLVGDLVATIGDGAARYTDVPEQPHVGDRATELLGRFGSAAGPKLIAALKSPNDWVRGHAAEALQKLKLPESDSPLVGAIGKESNDGVRASMASALLALGGPYAFDRMVSLADHSGPRVTDVAIKALGRLRSLRAIPCLERHLDLQSDGVVWGGETGSAEMALASLGNTGIKTLESHFGDKGEYRGEIANALSSTGDPGAASFLEHAYDRQSTHHDISYLPDATTVCGPLILRMMSDSDPEVRTRASSSLEHSVRFKDAPILSKLLLREVKRKTVDGEFCSNIATSLGQLRGTTASRGLKAALDALANRSDIDPLVQDDLLYPLIKIESPGSAETLVRYALGPRDIPGHSGEPPSWVAAQGCGKLGLVAVRPLSRAFGAGKLAASVYSAALSKVRDPSCVPILKAALKSDDQAVTIASRLALKNIQNPGWRAAQARTEDSVDRLAAIAKRGHEREAIIALKKLANNRSDLSRQAVVRAFHRPELLVRAEAYVAYHVQNSNRSSQVLAETHGSRSGRDVRDPRDRAR